MIIYVTFSGHLHMFAAFFKILPSAQLVFLRTIEQRSRDSFPESYRFNPSPVQPGFLQWHSWIPGDSEADEDGYHDAPAVWLGGALSNTGVAPHCCMCNTRMKYVGQADTAAFCEDLPDIKMMLFYCEGCEVECCMVG